MDTTACWPWSGGASGPRAAPSTPACWPPRAGPTWWCCPTAAAYQHPERVVLGRPSGSAARAPRSRGSWWSTGPRPRTPGWPRCWRAPASSTSPAARRCTCGPSSRGRPPSRPCARPWPRGAWWPEPGAGAMVLTDPMVDPRGGALTVGLGLVDSWPSSPSSATSTTTPTARSSSARWPWPRRRCPWWRSRRARRSIRDGRRHLALRGSGDAGGLPRRRRRTDGLGALSALSRAR